LKRKFSAYATGPVGPFSKVFRVDQIFSNATADTRHWSCSKKTDNGFYSKELLEKKISRANMILVKCSHAWTSCAKVFLSHVTGNLVTHDISLTTLTFSSLVFSIHNLLFFMKCIGQLCTYLQNAITTAGVVSVKVFLKGALSSNCNV